MSLQVLISCMKENIHEILQRTNVQTDAVVVNQCNDNFEETLFFINNKGRECKVKIVYTTERGLSRSRNMALRESWGDILLFCDDDETLEDDYEDTIKNAFNKTNAKIILFNIDRPDKKYPTSKINIGKFNCSKMCSVQMAIRREIREIVSFDEKMGSGTGNGGGEDNKFFVDCLKKGYEIIYEPNMICSVSQKDSQWFHGANRQYWKNAGWTSRRIYGLFWGYLFLINRTIKSSKVDHSNSKGKIFTWLNEGFFEQR